MATTVSRIRSGHDTWLELTRQHRSERRLRLRGTAQYAYLYLPLGPELRNVTILSATLHIWGQGTGWGTPTLTVERIGERWDAASLSWNNKPSVTGTAATLTQTNPTDPTEWAVDVKSLVQAFASGARWYGMRLSLSGTTERAFNSLNATARTPWLEVTWTDKPAAPVDLSPAGGQAVSLAKPVLTWSDENSPDRISVTAFRVQIDPAANGTTPAFDSGNKDTELAQYDLATSSYVGLANNATTKWRVQVSDETGLWSDWSDWATFTRVDKGTLTITTPGATVAEFTPPVAWTTSFTQTAWRVEVLDAADPATVLHNTGRKTGTTQSYTIPARDAASGKRILIDGRNYTVNVYAWDAVDRVAPRSVLTSRTFNFANSATPAQVTALVATQVTDTPYVDLTWTRATTPDSWTIVNNGKAVETDIPGADLIVSGTSYKYRFRDAKPGANTFQVKPTVNGLTADSPAATLTTLSTGLWIMGSDDIDVLVGVYPEQDYGTFAMPDRATVFDLPGLTSPVRVTQGPSGLRGHINGALQTWNGRTTEAWADRLLELKKRDEAVTLYLGFEVIRARIYDIVVEPSGDAGDTQKVAFEFFQVGDIDWLD